MRYPFDGKYNITQPFNQPNAAIWGGNHKGIDWGLPSGTPVLAVTAGRISGYGFDQKGGYYLFLSSGDFTFKYYHLSRFLVSHGQQVSEGQQLGASGASGVVTGPHLHFEVLRGSTIVDPLTIINNGGVFTAPASNPSPNDERYIIRAGDTFWSLEQARNIPHGTLQQLNPDIDPRKLQIGQSIRIRQVSQAPAQPAAQYYTIRAGDTFWSLESAWQMQHGTLQQLNPTLNARALQVGQQIKIG